MQGRNAAREALGKALLRELALDCRHAGPFLLVHAPRHVFFKRSKAGRQAVDGGLDVNPVPGRVGQPARYLAQLAPHGDQGPGLDGGVHAVVQRLDTSPVVPGFE